MKNQECQVNRIILHKRKNYITKKRFGYLGIRGDEIILESNLEILLVDLPLAQQTVFIQKSL
jgi:hypothetical protein